MIAKSELTAWLESLPPNDVVGIDDGGLILQSSLTDAYLEIGGIEPLKSRFVHRKS